MGSIGNNTSGKYSKLRDTFFGVEGFGLQNGNINGNGEVDYLQEILNKSKRARMLYLEFLKTPPEELYTMAMERIQMIDMGQVKNEDLEKVEGEIALILAGIDDLQLIKTKELTPDEDDFGRSM